MSAKYAVIFERAENNSAYVPDLPGCMTTAKTLDDTKATSAKRFMDTWRRCASYGDSIPKPTSLASEVELTTAA